MPLARPRNRDRWDEEDERDANLKSFLDSQNGKTCVRNHVLCVKRLGQRGRPVAAQFRLLQAGAGLPGRQVPFMVKGQAAPMSGAAFRHRDETATARGVRNGETGA